MIAALDRLLGRLHLWRSLRGGVWERWRLLGSWPPRARWFGPLPVPLAERVEAFEMADGAVLSLIRLNLWDTEGEIPPPTLAQLAQPSLRCEPGALVAAEDHRHVEAVA